jgi:hypothetical protein
MSKVTNIIITTAIDEPGVLNLNHALWLIEHPGFHQVDQHCGGNKAFESHVWLAAFNHLDIEEFKAIARAAAWEEPDRVQIFIREEQEERFEEFSVKAP